MPRPEEAVQLDLDEGRRRRDDGARVAEWATDVAWKVAADQAIVDLAATGRLFDAEDVRRIVGAPVAASPNAFGARFNAARARGVIVPVGYRTAQRPEAHGRPVRTWRGAA